MKGQFIVVFIKHQLIYFESFNRNTDTDYLEFLLIGTPTYDWISPNQPFVLRKYRYSDTLESK